MKKINNISFGLFGNRGKYWYLNVRDFWIFLRRVKFVLKHGYSPVLNWETYSWFIAVMKEVLREYRMNRLGDPWILEGEYSEELEESNTLAINEWLDHMIELLDRMDENNEIYENVEHWPKEEMMNQAKEEFFKEFSKRFYYLWD